VASLASRAQQLRAQLGATGEVQTLAASTGDASLTPVTVAMGPAESVNGLPTGEYVVNNWAYSAKPGDLSPAMKGDNGWYIVKLMGRTIPSELEFQRVKSQVVKAVYQEKVQRSMLDWMQNQKDHATIIDYRV